MGHLLCRPGSKRQQYILVIAPFERDLLSSPPIEVVCPPQVRAACIDVLRCLGDTALEIVHLCQISRDDFDIDYWPAMPVLGVAILELLKVLEGRNLRPSLP
jgi:hypothetical protein